MFNMPNWPIEGPLEQPGYLKITGEHIYTVFHRVRDPIARVLLVGPFAAERPFSYAPWVRWARFLAGQRIEALRFDYRGVGESTGAFEDMSFDIWNDDVEFLAGWLGKQSPTLPLILHGLELGALFASKAFAAGLGSAGLFWAAPTSANNVLRNSLLRQVAVDQVFADGVGRKRLSDYVQGLELQQSLEVEGYHWSGKFWRDSFQCELPFTKARDSWVDKRPVRFVELDKHAAPLVGTSGLRFTSVINPNLSELFTDNVTWMTNALTMRE